MDVQAIQPGLNNDVTERGTKLLTIFQSWKIIADLA